MAFKVGIFSLLYAGMNIYILRFVYFVSIQVVYKEVFLNSKYSVFTT